MPPRTPLGKISGNARKPIDLTPFERGQICGKASAGQSVAEISSDLKIPDSTIRRTINLHPQRINGKSLSKFGRHRISTALDVRNILRLVRANPKITYKKIRKELDIVFSSDTLKRILERKGIKNWRRKRKPFLTPEVVYKRYQWAKAHKDWTMEDWKKIIFSDECSLERGSGGARIWAFRTPAQKQDKEMIEPYKKGKDIRIMIWGGIWIKGRSNIIIIIRDEDTKKKSFTQRSYLTILKEAIPRCWQPGQIFIQNNTSTHTASAVKEWFENKEISLLNQPLYSPDLNPIEHLWHLMKYQLQEHRPELYLAGKSEADQNALGRVIVEAWDAIPQGTIDNLIMSMSRRCKAVLKAKDWHTKYQF